MKSDQNIKQNHDQIHHLIQLAADDRLDATQRAKLDAHLVECRQCRDYANEIHTIEKLLSSGSPTRLVPSSSQQKSQQPSATLSKSLTATIHTRYRRYQLNKQILSFTSILTVLAAVIVFFILFGRIIPNNPSPADAPLETSITTATQSPTNTPFETMDIKNTPGEEKSLIQELSTQAGFEIAIPTWLPEGYTLSGTSYNSEKNIACLLYRSPLDSDSATSLVIAQGPFGPLPTDEELWDFDYQSYWSKQAWFDPRHEEYGIAQRTTSAVPGATEDGYYYTRGILNLSLYCQQTGLEVEKALTWQDQKHNFIVFAQEDIYQNGNFLTEAEMQKIAGGLNKIPAAHPFNRLPDYERITNIEEVHSFADFSFRQPTTLPGPYEFLYASVWPLTLVYQSTSGEANAPGLIFVENSSPSKTLEELYNEAPQVYERVTINGQPGLFSAGFCVSEDYKPIADCGTPQILTWFEDGIAFSFSGYFDKEAILATAENLQVLPNKSLQVIPTQEEVITDITPKPIIKTSMGDLIYISSRFTNEVMDSKPEPGEKILVIVLERLDGIPIDIEMFAKAQIQGSPYLLGDSSIAIREGAGQGFLVDSLDEFVISFRVPNSVKTFELIWGKNDPIEIIPTESSLTTTTPTPIPPPSPSEADDTSNINVQAGFDVIEPSSIPAGYILSDTTYHAAENITCLHYRSPLTDDQAPPVLIVAQSSDPLPPVPELTEPYFDAVDTSPTVPIGGVKDGQGNHYPYNSFEAKLYCGNGNQTFYDAVYWQVGDTYFAVLFKPASYMVYTQVATLLDVRRLAESMTGVSTIPVDAIDPERMPSIAVAENYLKVDLLEPTYIPVGYDFLYASYHERTILWVELVYSYDSYDIYGMSISIDLTASVTLTETYEILPGEYEKVIVKNKEALYSLGSCTEESVKPGSTCYAASTLLFFESNMRYMIMGYLSKEEVIAIAESISSRVDIQTTPGLPTPTPTAPPPEEM